MTNYYHIGIGTSQPGDGITQEFRQRVAPITDNLRNRISDLKVGIGMWNSADNRFYRLGVNPGRIARRDITGVPTVDKVANMALDWVHIGMLGLSIVTIRAALV